MRAFFPWLLSSLWILLVLYTSRSSYKPQLRDINMFLPVLARLHFISWNRNGMTRFSAVAVLSRGRHASDITLSIYTANRLLDPVAYYQLRSTRRRRIEHTRNCQLMDTAELVSAYMLKRLPAVTFVPRFTGDIRRTMSCINHSSQRPSVESSRLDDKQVICTIRNAKEIFIRVAAASNRPI